MSKPKTYPRTGVAYVAAVEHEYMSANKLTICNNCMALGFNKPLKRCNGCLMVDYCSKEYCHPPAGKGKKNAYLTTQNRDEVLRLVIDTYRLRVELDHLHCEEDHGMYFPGKWEDGIVWVKGEAIEDFQRWLDLAEASGILPEWWRFEDRMETLGFALDKGDKESIFNAIDQVELITRYGGDTSIRNAMCILAELVVGYEGKGPAKDDKWYMRFSEHLDLHPEVRARLIKGSVEAVSTAFEQHEKDVAQPEAIESKS